MPTQDMFKELFSLDGCVAVVTGGSAGIGLGIAEVLARAGAKVIVTGRNQGNAEAAAARLREEGLDVAAVQLDPADESSVVEACREIIAIHGTPWILVNISSRVAQGRMMAGLSAYVSSKTGMVGLSMASATELVDHAITVNTLLPGGVMTPGGMSAKRPELDPGKMPPRPPMGMSSPKDIGAAVLFFASPAAHKITNQVVALDAGFSVVL